MAALYVLQGPDKGRTFEVGEQQCVLGRHSVHAPLSDHTVSRRHVLLECLSDGWRLEDLGSSNGTYVNGERIGNATRLVDGDQVKIGSTLLVFRYPDEREVSENRPAMDGMVDLTAADGIDSAIVSAIHASEESVILASPEATEAVHAWKIMYKLGEAFGTIRSIESFLEQVLDIVLENLVVDRAFVLLRKSRGDGMEPVAVRFRNRRERQERQIVTSRRIVNHVVETRNGVLCTNAVADRRFATDVADVNDASLESLAMRSVLCVPVCGRDGVHGVIHLDCPVSRHTYTYEQLRLATAIGKVIGLAIENHRLSEARMQNERLAATGETVAYLSHHIRNILQGMRSGADVVELGLKRENLLTLRSGWQTVENNLERILHLTTNMLTFSKDRRPRIEFAQLNEIVEDAVNLARRQADDKGTMILTALGQLSPVPVDPAGIHQAVFNLIINAVAACPPDGGKITVATVFEASKNEVTISVSDNGLGIPKARLREIFQPFHSSKGQGGTGLGLAAAKKIIDELAGRISVSSRPDVGTRFVISLPCERTTITDFGKTDTL